MKKYVFTKDSKLLKKRSYFYSFLYFSIGCFAFACYFFYLFKSFWFFIIGFLVAPIPFLINEFRFYVLDMFFPPRIYKSHRKIEIGAALVYKSKRNYALINYDEAILLYRKFLFNAMKIVSNSGKKIKIDTLYKNHWLIWELVINRVREANPDAIIDARLENKIAELKVKSPNAKLEFTTMNDD